MNNNNTLNECIRRYVVPGEWALRVARQNSKYIPNLNYDKCNIYHTERNNT